MMSMRLLVTVFCFLLLAACSLVEQESDQGTWYFIPNRQGTPTYRIKVLPKWQVVPSDKNQLQDTKVPIVTLVLQQNEDKILLTVHSFPVDTGRIHPNAQVARWKKQFDEVDPFSVFLSPETRNGFGGLFFEASGKLSHHPATMSVLAWSLLLDSRHIQTLSYNKEMQADITMKVVGPKKFVEEHKVEIIKCVKTFELIDPIDESF